MKRELQILMVGLCGLLLAPARGDPPRDGPGAAEPAAAAKASASGPAASRPGRSASGDSAAISMTDEVAMAFQNAPIEQICKFLSDSKGKPVLVHESVRSKTITIVSGRKLPRKEALLILEEALRQSGIVLEESATTIKVIPISAIKQMALTVVPDGTSVDTIGEPGKIEDKVFVIKYYDVAKLKDIIVPMLAGMGHITADPGTRTLVVTDTVANLSRIERLVAMLDVPASQLTRTEIIQIEKGDAVEIASMISMLLKGLGREVAGAPMPGAQPPGPSMGGDGRAMIRGGGEACRRRAAPAGACRCPAPAEAGPAPSGPGQVILEPAKSAIAIVADVVRNRIIVVAPSDVQEQVKQWVAQLDQARKTEEVFEVLSVEHADVEEVATQITRTLENMPQGDLK